MVQNVFNEVYLLHHCWDIWSVECCISAVTRSLPLWYFT